MGSIGGGRMGTEAPVRRSVREEASRDEASSRDGGENRIGGRTDGRREGTGRNGEGRTGDGGEDRDGGQTPHQRGLAIPCHVLLRWIATDSASAMAGHQGPSGTEPSCPAVLCSWTWPGVGPKSVDESEGADDCYSVRCSRDLTGLGNGVRHAQCPAQDGRGSQLNLMVRWVLGFLSSASDSGREACHFHSDGLSEWSAASRRPTPFLCGLADTRPCYTPTIGTTDPSSASRHQAPPSFRHPPPHSCDQAAAALPDGGPLMRRFLDRRSKASS